MTLVARDSHEGVTVLSQSSVTPNVPSGVAHLMVYFSVEPVVLFLSAPGIGTSSHPRSQDHSTRASFTASRRSVFSRSNSASASPKRNLGCWASAAATVLHGKLFARKWDDAFSRQRQRYWWRGYPKQSRLSGSVVPLPTPVANGIIVATPRASARCAISTDADIPVTLRNSRSGRGGSRCLRGRSKEAIRPVAGRSESGRESRLSHRNFPLGSCRGG